jgi:hypothetical protein
MGMIHFAFVTTLIVIQPAAPPANTQPKSGEVNVQVIGCVSGDTLTETNLNRGTSSEGLNPTRRWRLRLTKAQRATLKEISDRQIEIFGAAKESEIKSAMLVKRAKVGKAHVYVGAESSRRPGREQAGLPTLTVATFAARSDVCR